MFAGAAVPYHEVADPKYGGNLIVHERWILATLIALIDLIPMPAVGKRRGRPMFHPDRLFSKALVIAIVRRLTKVHTLLTVLDLPTDEMHELSALLTENGRYPSRRTFERRLKAIPETLPAQIGCLGHYLVALILPWQDCARAGAIESTLLRASGGVWHKKDREAGKV